MKSIAVVLLLAGTAHAGGLTLASGGLFVQLNLETNVGAGTIAKPVSIAPDISVGATHDLTFSLIHSTFGTTGFRGGAGLGLCVTGTSDGCAHVYNNVGGEAVYSVLAGDASMALVGGLYSLDLADSFVNLKLGIKTKLSSGRLALTVNPSVFTGLDKRDAMVPNGDQLYVPIGLSYNVSPVVTAGVGTGVKGPLGGFSKFGDTFLVPLGVNALVKLDPAFAIGGSFTFGKLGGGQALADAATGADFRALHVWLNYSR
ncbi:MAG: hypothetical protein ABI467_06680 [Kofleriaceae bacterium]